jgi:hypothetical protein
VQYNASSPSMAIDSISSRDIVIKRLMEGTQ